METRTATRPLLDEQLEAIAHAHRRRLLFSLLESNPRSEVPAELDGGPDDSGHRELLIAMRHTHLPKLEERGYVRWDRQNGRVTKGPRFDEVEPLLAVLDEYHDELPGNRA